MNQAEVTKLMTTLKIAVKPRHRNLRNIDGPEGRLLKLRKTVTALVQHERIELFYNRADEARGYAERVSLPNNTEKSMFNFNQMFLKLISDAIRYGDCHKTTMEMADFWLLEKQLVHKLFKVLVPRFQNYDVSFTRMYRAPREYPGIFYKNAVLELRGNPYPSLVSDQSKNRNLIHNVLLDEARKDYRKQKYAEIAEKLKLNITENSTNAEPDQNPIEPKS